MEFTDFDEPIIVAAVFEGGNISPKWFMRVGRKYIIKKTEFVWNEKQGNQELINFSVTADKLCAELAFNKKLLTWHLKKVISE